VCQPEPESLETAHVTARRIPRMQGIDGLRAIAVAAVFVYHANASWLPGGFLGVDVFFVISGLLITSLLLAEYADTGRIALGGFWLRRGRRLLPAVFALLGVCLLVAATVARHRLDVRGDAVAAMFYVSNWKFVFEQQNYFDQFGSPPVLQHLWSLAVEEQFYLLWPILLLVGLRFVPRRLPLLVGSAVLASTALMWALYERSDPSRAYYGTDTRMAPLLVGALLAFFWKPGALPSVRRPRGRVALDALSVAALSAVALSFFLVDSGQAALYHGAFLALAACTALLLACVVHPASSAGRVLEQPTLRWLGERSYAIYLWHWPVIVLTLSNLTDDIHAGVLLAVQLAATLALADLSYRLVERPIRRGALRRVKVRVPHLAAGARVSVIAGTTGVAALLALVVATPPSRTALPPGFTAPVLLASNRSGEQLAQLPRAAPATRRAAPSSAAKAVDGAKPVPQTGPILAIGDSVMLGASSALAAALGRNLRIDAVVARQADDTIDRILAYQDPSG